MSLLLQSILKISGKICRSKIWCQFRQYGDRLSMERMKKKKKSGCALFVRFFIKLVAAVLLAFLLWLLQITVSVGNGSDPACGRRKKRLLPTFTPSAHIRTSCLPGSHPPAATPSMTHPESFLKRTCPVPSAKMQIFSHFPGRIPLRKYALGELYVKRQTDTRIVVLTYDFRSAFANPTPGVSFRALNCWKCFSCCSCSSCSFCTRHHAAGKIPVAGAFHLQEAADEIRNQNLDFTIRPTAICEFNQVAASLDALKSELSGLLKRAVAHAAATQTSVFRARP